MSNYTSNYSFKKPLGSEDYNIEDQNGNWDIADNVFSQKANVPKAFSKDLLINTTNSQVIATYTPSMSGNFQIKSYMRVLANANVTILVNYTDSTGSQTKAILPDNLGLSFPSTTGIQSYKVGSYILKSLFINAIAGSPITITVTSNIANKVYISSTIQEV